MRALITTSSLALLAAHGLALDVQAEATPAPQSATEATASAASEEPMEAVKVVAVLSYADWCGSCKALDPKIASVKASASFEGVKFARIDYTQKDSDAFFAKAAGLGVEPALRAEFAAQIKTGKMYLISAESGEIISRIDKSMTEAEISATITSSAA